jgi:hypothetical protein
VTANFVDLAPHLKVLFASVHSAHLNGKAFRDVDFEVLTLIEVRWKAILAINFHENWEVDVALHKSSRASSVMICHEARQASDR